MMPPGGRDRYAEAGVSVDANNRTTDWIRRRLARQPFPQLLSGIGGFSGLWDLSGLRRPVLAATTDSIGTKVKIAAALKLYDGLGYDIVNHCANDVLASGATPLFFLDYLGLHRNESFVVEAIVGSIAAACEAAGVALLGGETAELPDLYAEGDFDLAGTMVGAAERVDLLTPDLVRPGDALVGLPSSGLHTNGYTLARRLIPAEEWDLPALELGDSYGNALLAPHRSYVAEVKALRASCRLHALAHVTGGGITDNLPRSLADGQIALVDLGAIELPPLFRELLRRGNLSDDEALRTFNLGIGMVAIVPPEDVASARALVPGATVVGEVALGEGVPGVRYGGSLLR